MPYGSYSTSRNLFGRKKNDPNSLYASEMERNESESSLAMFYEQLGLDTKAYELNAKALESSSALAREQFEYSKTAGDREYALAKSESDFLREMYLNEQNENPWSDLGLSSKQLKRQQWEEIKTANLGYQQAARSAAFAQEDARQKMRSYSAVRSGWRF